MGERGRRRAGPGRRQTVLRPTRARGNPGALLAAAAAGGALALSGVLATGDGIRADPQLTAESVAASAASPSPSVRRSAPAPASQAPAPTTTSTPRPGDPNTPAATAFLDALRADEIPTSQRGLIEVQVAEAVCSETDAGTSRTTMEQGIPGVLPTVTSAQAAVLIDAALEHYC